MNMKEYGGYLPLEIHTGSEYYANTDACDIARVNSGRTALSLAIMLCNASKIYIPVYNCESVEKELKKRKIAYGFYSIDKNFMPIGVNLKPDEYLVYINYYGIMPREQLRKIKEQYKNVIFDNTQAFFSQPFMDCFNCYSCRKFIGVSDGAYLIKKGIEIGKLHLGKDQSYQRAKYLLKCIDCGTNAAYADHLYSEEDIAQDILEMSNLTRLILSSADYERIKEKRVENFLYLHKYLAAINQLDIDRTEQIPMVYPLLIADETMRAKLVENKVYIPQWWKYVLGNERSNDWERCLSQFLLPIPIDQRYGQTDMENILKIILDKGGVQ